MAQSIVISDDIWDELSQVARREKRQPQALVIDILRGYLESEPDEALFREMQDDEHDPAPEPGQVNLIPTPFYGGDNALSDLVGLRP